MHVAMVELMIYTHRNLPTLDHTMSAIILMLVKFEKVLLYALGQIWNLSWNYEFALCQQWPSVLNMVCSPVKHNIN